MQKSAGSSAVLLCNRSVARFKAGDFEGSLEDAEEALEVLQADKKAISEESMKVSQASELTLQKALYRKVSSLPRKSPHRHTFLMRRPISVLTLGCN